MRLAEDIVLRFEREVITLRPTLRAATKLERRFGGFDALFKAIGDGNVTTIAAIIGEGALEHPDAEHIAEMTLTYGLRDTLDAIKLPLQHFTLLLAGIDPTEPSKPVLASAKRVTHAEHFKRLFQIATGWLGWTPETAWNSTPAEIMEAFDGRKEMLKAIFGGKEEDTQDASLPSAEEVQSNLALLRGLAG